MAETKGSDQLSVDVRCVLYYSCSTHFVLEYRTFSESTSLQYLNIWQQRASRARRLSDVSVASGQQLTQESA
jgi:hypothetical protein